MRIYQPGDEWITGEFPSILAIGDSWFWYPKNNILRAVIEHPALKDPFRTIQMLGYNGAQLNEFVGSGKYASEFDNELGPDASKYYSAVMISGGGNDAVDYRLALKRDCTGITVAEECLEPDGLDGLLRDISGSLGLMIHDIAWVFGKQTAWRMSLSTAMRVDAPRYARFLLGGRN